jgi:ribosomal protein L35AE/L33A
MDSDLQFLVHFFNNKEYLFKTITMADISQMDEICNTISSQRGWYWPRFAQSERHDYLKRRLFVEKALYEDFTQSYGSLKEKIPVFFYLYPNITAQKAIQLAQQRTRHNEKEPQVMMVKIQDIEDTKNITFTLNDSHTAYWKRAMEAGIKCRGDGYKPIVLEDHNKVFPFSMIEQLHQKYRAQQITYEVQIWDYQLLEKLSYTIPGKEET